MYKLGGNRRYQRRLFRCDGNLLVCLSPIAQKLHPNQTSQISADFLLNHPSIPVAIHKNALKDYYAFTPELPPKELVNLLLSGHEASTANPDVYSHDYYLPKWSIPINTITEVKAHGLLKKNRNSAESRTFTLFTQSKVTI